MRLIGEEGIDLAVLPIGDNNTMGPDEALRAALGSAFSGLSPRLAARAGLISRLASFLIRFTLDGA